MNFGRASKYLLIIGVSSALWWLGVADETALGLKPSDLNGFAAPIFAFYFLTGPIVFILSYYFPYIIIVGAAAVLVAWWKMKQNWTWTTALVSIVFAGAASAFSLLTGIGKPLQFAFAAMLLVIFIRRIKGSPLSCWIDAFGKVEVVFLTIAVMWLLPDWDRIVQRDRFRQTAVEVPPYATRYAREMNDAAVDAVARFPNQAACLVNAEENPQSLESLQIDWTKISRTDEAEVCIFRVLSALDGIEASRPFMEAQGFSMQSSSFSPENPYVEQRDGALRISASWSVHDNGPKFPTHGVLDRIRASVPYGMSVNVYFSQDGNRVLAVQVGYSTL